VFALTLTLSLQSDIKLGEGRGKRELEKIKE